MSRSSARVELEQTDQAEGAARDLHQERRGEQEGAEVDHPLLGLDEVVGRREAGDDGDHHDEKGDAAEGPDDRERLVLHQVHPLAPLAHEPGPDLDRHNSGEHRERPPCGEPPQLRLEAGRDVEREVDHDHRGDEQEWQGESGQAVDRGVQREREDAEGAGALGLVVDQEEAEEERAQGEDDDDPQHGGEHAADPGLPRQRCREQQRADGGEEADVDDRRSVPHHPGVDGRHQRRLVQRAHGETERDRHQQAHGRRSVQRAPEHQGEPGEEGEEGQSVDPDREQVELVRAPEGQDVAPAPPSREQHRPEQHHEQHQSEPGELALDPGQGVQSQPALTHGVAERRVQERAQDRGQDGAGPREPAAPQPAGDRHVAHGDASTSTRPSVAGTRACPSSVRPMRGIPTSW